MTLVWKSGLNLQSPASNDPLLDLNTQPSLDLQFATGKTLDDRVSGLPLVNHQRDASSGKSAGTYVGSDGLIKTSPVNRWLHSENVGSWARLSATVSDNDGLAPDGTQTADKVNYSAITTNWSIVYQGVFTGTYTWSGWIKTADNTTKDIYLTRGNSIETHTFTATGEWQRFEAVVTPNNENIHLGNASNSTPQSWNGGEFYIWGAQLEEGSTVNTYVPTTTVASGAPRFDHDPVTGESLGLLIEESRTNLTTYSNTFQKFLR